MNSTSAVEVIIQALCPGPGDDSALGVPLVTYASRSATRVARSGPEATPGPATATAGTAAAGGAAAGGASSALARPAAPSTTIDTSKSKQDAAAATVLVWVISCSSCVAFGPTFVTSAP